MCLLFVAFYLFVKVSLDVLPYVVWKLRLLGKDSWLSVCCFTQVCDLTPLGFTVIWKANWICHIEYLSSSLIELIALRRYQAVHWLDYLVGPLGIKSQPSEIEFISCLRNGLILCNLMNKIRPGSVPKVYYLVFMHVWPFIHA